ncbi:uncharacterized protein [Leptinotarsa decemlineata]|uniref:uncharacterized protein n=1 Tax=Leptinotarsa decemlineata TaxID=7539 RepID=UPI003D307431
MKSTANRGKLSYFKYILKLCNFLGVATPKESTWWYRSFAVMGLVLEVCGAIISFFAKLNPVFDSYQTEIKIADEVANVFLTLAVATAEIQMIAMYPGKLHEILDNLLKFDKNVGVNPRCRKLKTIFWISFPTALLIVPTIIILDSWVWLDSVSMDMYKYYVVRNIQYCQVCALIVFWFWLAIEILHRFSILNGILETIRETSLDHGKLSIVKDLTEEVEPVENGQDILEKVTEYHNFLCEVVNDVNDLFGLIILFFEIFVIGYVVQYTSVIILYTVLKEPMIDIRFRERLALVSAAWIFVSGLKVVFLSTAGHFVEKEANRTIVICYNLINNLKRRANYERLKEELQDLSQQVARRNPRLTASGFFVINLTMLGCIVSSVTSYIIIALQFFK